MDPPNLRSLLNGAWFYCGPAMREKWGLAVAPHADLSSSLDLACIIVQFEAREELRFLFLPRLYNGRMAMSQYVDGDTCHEVKVDLPIAVPHVRAFTTHESNGLPLEGSLVILVFQGDPVTFFCRFHVCFLL